MVHFEKDTRIYKYFVFCFVGAVGGEGGDEDDKEKEEEAERERQEAIREAEERRKEKHRKMEEEREKMRQEIRDKVSNDNFAITFLAKSSFTPKVISIIRFSYTHDLFIQLELMPSWDFVNFNVIYILHYCSVLLFEIFRRNEVLNITM